MTTQHAVLLMAYGTPTTLDDVGPYFTDIRGGRTPSAEAVAHLRARYARIGGGTPLRRITETVRLKLEEQLAVDHEPRAVFVGMKHWHPFIADTLVGMQSLGVERITALALAPHYSRMSVGAYQRAVSETNDRLGNPFEVTFVDEWGMESSFIACIATRLQQALARFSANGTPAPTVVFTAHSLPVRIREWKDPYEAQLLASSAAVARTIGVSDWRFAWQSAGGTTEPWIGPDILDYLDVLKADGVRRVVQVPIGFVSDHLEVLYDIDIEATERARELDMELIRTQLPNASPDFIRALAAVVQRAERRQSVIA